MICVSGNQTPPSPSLHLTRGRQEEEEEVVVVVVMLKEVVSDIILPLSTCVHFVLSHIIMVQRVTYKRRHAYNTRSNKIKMYDLLAAAFAHASSSISRA